MPIKLTHFISVINEAIAKHGFGNADIVSIRLYSVKENGVFRSYYQIKLNDDSFIRVYTDN